MSAKNKEVENLTSQLISRLTQLAEAGHLPNGAHQLFVGSGYRRDNLIAQELAELNLYRGEPGFDEAWKKQAEQYNPFSGENLAATAFYQHNRHTPQDPRFPIQGSEEYESLKNAMGEVGECVEQLLRHVPHNELSVILRSI